ncbi:hypothetical protein N0V88_002418 [Collariella sp. IMI 366227]|nr:hypothetical protein N0V88_002418 [Collariella sp. IMI 366227]
MRQHWLSTEPSPRVFNFTASDATADLASRTGKLLHCHALVSPQHFPAWLSDPGANWTSEALTEALTRHVRTVVGYYRGRCRAWDVVSGALNEEGEYRPNVLYEVLGEEYIVVAFRVAGKWIRGRGCIMRIGD